MNAVAIPDLTLEAFEAGDVDVASFDHEGHVYVGWLYLEKYPLFEAIGRYCAALRYLTAKLGVPEKYHETITWFFLIQIAERRDRGGPAEWFVFRRRNPELFRAGPLLSDYYSKELLASEFARKGFALPDRPNSLPLRTGR